MRGCQHQDHRGDDADPGASSHQLRDQEHERHIGRSEDRTGDAAGHVVASGCAERRVGIDRSGLQPVFTLHLEEQRCRSRADRLGAGVEGELVGSDRRRGQPKCIEHQGDRTESARRYDRLQTHELVL